MQRSQALHPLFPPQPTLPIDAVIPQLLQTLKGSPVTLLSASPGAGKTTRVPLALLRATLAGDSAILMLEPRRLATQRAAEYMASLLGEQPGASVGYRIRGASRVSASTRVQVVTEGILTRMLQDTPELPGTGILIFDEFHERSIHADLGLALALDVQAHLRPDLRILIMSATLDGVGLSRLLHDAPIIDSPGRQYPVETIYAAFAPAGPLEKSVVQAAGRALEETEGDILVFLPGRRELRRTRDALLDRGLPPGTHVHLLHGEADPSAQRAALASPQPGERKIILATSVAETSLTIDGVRVVIDAGLARVPRFDPRRGMTGLETIPVSAATADQRRGRAGRQAPGVCYRLWTETAHRALQEYPAPEILAADLAPLALDLARWGSPDGASLRFIDPPPTDHLSQARSLLTTLGALDQHGRLSPHGKEMGSLPLHPRLAHMVIRARDLGRGFDACTVAALLDGPPIQRGPQSTDIDLATVVHGLADRGGDRAARLSVHAEAERLRRLLDISPSKESPGENYGPLLALAYPDRIARRREEHGRKYLLANGTGAQLPEWSLLARAEFLAVGDVDNAGVDARILLAAPLTLDEITRTAADAISEEEEIHWDSREAMVTARRATRLGALLLSEQSIPPAGDAVRDAIAGAMLEGVRETGLAGLPWTASAIALRSRSEWLRRSNLAGGSWPDMSDEALLATLPAWLGSHVRGMTRREHLARLELTSLLNAILTREQRVLLDRLAPATLTTPSGNRVTLEYGMNPQPVMAVRLQEMFGQTGSPTVGGGAVRVVVHLLSPAGRPLAVTSDLASFWSNAYTEVRKQMRGRYPKHRWPENPLEAAPGSSRKRRGPMPQS